MAQRPRKTSTITPGKLQDVLDFVKTRERNDRRERLTSPEALGAWLAQHELLDADAPLDEADWRNALEIRDGLQALVAARDGDASGDAIARLNGSFGDIPYRVRFARGGNSFSRYPTGTGWPLVRARLLDIVLQAMNDRQWKRLKVCPGCAGYFFDDARNANTRWCPGKRCLSRVTSARYRKRPPPGSR